jgi:tRNA(adenine34) deaminase
MPGSHRLSMEHPIRKLDVFSWVDLNHQTEVRGGVLADECSKLLKDFFSARRK